MEFGSTDVRATSRVTQIGRAAFNSSAPRILSAVCERLDFLYQHHVVQPVSPGAAAHADTLARHRGAQRKGSLVGSPGAVSSPLSIGSVHSSRFNPDGGSPTAFAARAFNAKAPHNSPLMGTPPPFSHPLFGAAGTERPIANFDAAAQRECEATLNILVHMLGWIDLNAAVTPATLASLFAFIPLGEEIGRLALNAANELLERNCRPPNFEEYMVHIFQHVFLVLRTFSASRDQLEEVDAGTLGEISRFVALFLQRHVQRIEGSSHFPVPDFLMLLFKYTQFQPTPEAFMYALEIWDVFIEFVVSDVTAGQEAIRAKYGIFAFERACAPRPTDTCPTRCNRDSCSFLGNSCTQGSSPGYLFGPLRDCD